MKKTFSLILAVLMVFTVIPFTAVSAASTAPTTCFGPLSLEAYQVLGSSGIDFTVESEGDKTFYHGVAEPGSYNNNGLLLTFSAIDFNIIDYPYIKINYRSDSVSPKLDVTSRSSVGESWMSPHPRNAG